jgi:tRNA(fMet)-specific endonuclease VapC
MALYLLDTDTLTLLRANHPEVIRRFANTTTIAFFNGLPVLNFIVAAISEYERLKSLKINVGKNDLRIASIALVNNAIVVTRTFATSNAYRDC